ncbi:hypothetical protein AZA_65980 [Nitrospirillum viridazoti Y2]|nr:hypothetical protein AZA_65980 [Nitrospirillum amazonense Y2]
MPRRNNPRVARGCWARRSAPDPHAPRPMLKARPSAGPVAVWPIADAAQHDVS